MINNLKELLESVGVETPSRLGRSFYKYVDCGPWTSFLTKSKMDIYYEDRGVNEEVTNDNCIGIKIGSIVEGSDAEIYPVTLNFPFTDEYLWEVIEEINQEACAEWDIANEECDWGY